MATIGKNWNPELTALEQQLLAQDAQVELNAINYAKGYGLGVHVPLPALSGEIRQESGFYRTADSSEGLLSYASVFNCGYGLLGYGAQVAVSNGTSVPAIRVRSRQSPDEWGSTVSLYHSENFTPPEDRAAGAVGTYAFLKYTGSGGGNPGTTRAGSTLEWSNAASSISGIIGNPSGTWRCMGLHAASGGQETTLWLRIS